MSSPSGVLAGFRRCSERRQTALALAACVALALVMRAPYVLAPLGRDEGGVAFVARNWLSGHGSLYGAYWLDRPPLLLALYRAAVAGGALGVRALGALSAVALVLAVAQLGRSVGGQRAGRIAGVLAAVLTGSVAIGAVFTPAELLAAVPSTLSVWCLVAAHRGRRTRLVVAAGAWAVCAALIKQSFLDAGFAGAVFVIAAAAGTAHVRWRWPLAYVAGAAGPLALLAAWQAVVVLPPGGFVYALIGFRIDALRTLGGADAPLWTRLTALVLPALGSGLVAAMLIAVAGLRRLRADPVVAATLTAWLVADLVGVLAGGSYWPHYLIELVPVTCVAAGVALADAARRVRIAAGCACLIVPFAVSMGAAAYAAIHPPRHPELAVAGYIREHARPGDTQYVMYARPDVVYYAGLQSPYPYAWTLMVRAVPGARRRLVRLLASDRRPTWLVEWQDDDSWRLDRGGVMDLLVRRGYRLADTVCGHGVYLRDDRRLPPARAAPACR